MSRTRKGKKGPGWEPWFNLRERQEQKADYLEPELSPGEEARLDEICPGCPICECVKCGGVMQDVDSDTELRCTNCGHVEICDSFIGPLPERSEAADAAVAKMSVFITEDARRKGTGPDTVQVSQSLPTYGAPPQENAAGPYRREK